MPLFPSREWMEAFCARVEGHPEAPEVAAVLAGVYRFVVEPAGALTERQAYDLEVRPGEDGGPPEVRPVDGPGAAPRLTISADYNRWRQLVSGELDLGLAVMLRRVKVSGDIGALTRGLSSTRPLLDAMNAVETEWLA